MLRRLEEINMGFVEKFEEIEQARGELETQLYNKINFIKSLVNSQD